MRVLCLLDGLNTGGLEMMLLDLAKKSKDNDLDIIFVSMRGGDLENEFKKTENIFIKLNRKYPFDISVIYQLKKIIKKYNVNIIHSHLPIAALHAYCASIGTKSRNILTHHGISPYLNKRDLLLQKFIVPKMDANITVSKSFLERLKIEKKYNVKNFVVVYNGLDVEKFNCSNKDFRKEKGINQSDVLLGMVGNFVNNKNQITICRALPSVFERFDNVKFFFIGNKSNLYPKEFEECYNFCSKNNLLNKIFFIEKVSNISRILPSLDIFVFSSINESFGIAPLEAMLCCVPVIAADIPVILEITKNGKFAELFEKENPNDLSSKIIKLINDPEERLLLARESRVWVNEHFTIEQHISNLKKLYTQILNSNN